MSIRRCIRAALSCCLLTACSVPDGTSESSSASESSTSESSTNAESGTAGETGEATETGETGAELTACADEWCSEDQWCQWSDNTCGEADDDDGSCQPRPTECDDYERPVCGCDDVIYTNECLAEQAGVSYWSDASHCPAPDGTFVCGPTYCSSTNEYCWHQESDVWSDPGYFMCKPRSSSCMSCDCIPTQDTCSCTETDGNFQVDCDAL